MRKGTRKEVTLVLGVTFEGTYYDADETVQAAMDFIHVGLEDRDDLRGVRLLASGVTETGLTEES